MDILGWTKSVGEHLRGEVGNDECVETATTKLGDIHERLDGDVGVDGLGVLELADPCVFDGGNDDGATAPLCGFIRLEIVPKRFDDGLGA